MAQKVHIVLEDDLDGSEATQTVTFGLDGTSYEIDLNDKHAPALRDAVASYVGHGRKVSGSRRGRRSASARRAGASAREIRDWARSNGHKVPERDGFRPTSARPSKRALSRLSRAGQWRPGGHRLVRAWLRSAARRSTRPRSSSCAAI